MNALTEFMCEAAQPAPRPDRLALLVGSVVTPTLSVEPYLAQVEALAEQIKPALAERQGITLLHALIQTLGHEMGFRGNAADYYNPDNSFLHRVLENRLGLPITLSLLYMSIGQRLNIHLTGLGLPGHFMLYYSDSQGEYLIDPFHQTCLPASEVESYLSNLFQSPVQLQMPLSAYEVDSLKLILRLLNNLRMVYITQQDFQRTLDVLNFMVVVAPQEATLWRERGLLHFQSQALLAAESDLRRFFFRANQLHHFVEQRPVAGLQPFIPVAETVDQSTEPSSETLELLTVIDRIRRDVARLN